MGEKLTRADLRIRTTFWFAIADRLYGAEMAQLPYGPSTATLRRKLAMAAYNRGCVWQERMIRANVRLLADRALSREEGR